MNVRPVVGSIFAVALLLTESARAGEPVWTARWSELSRSGRLSAGAVIPPDGESSFEILRLKAADAAASGGALRIVTIDRPALATKRWKVTGKIRYAGVNGDGYLELWNHFPGGGRYFTRTLAPAGPMGKISGSSEWRDIELPFDGTGSPTLPERLELAVILPGSEGTVDLGPLALEQLPEGAPAGSTSASTPGAWWGDRDAGLVFGSLGALLGLVGAALGTLASLGRARSAVLFVWRVMIAAGAASFAAGIVALAMRQPYAVYYPLIILGVIMGGVFAFTLRSVKRRYEEAELRKMSAMDARL